MSEDPICGHECKRLNLERLQVIEKSFGEGKEQSEHEAEPEEAEEDPAEAGGTPTDSAELPTTLAPLNEDLPDLAITECFVMDKKLDVPNQYFPRHFVGPFLTNPEPTEAKFGFYSPQSLKIQSKIVEIGAMQSERERREFIFASGF